jgi:hypothetical protein
LWTFVPSAQNPSHNLPFDHLVTHLFGSSNDRSLNDAMQGIERRTETALD